MELAKRLKDDLERRYSAVRKVNFSNNMDTAERIRLLKDAKRR